MDIPADQERADFSARLKASLRAAKLPSSAGAFAKEFNLRANGASVSVYAVRKWLNGDAIPTQDKIHILARWIGISVQWLRYGEEDGAPGDAFDLAASDLKLINDIRLLNEAERKVLEVIVRSLLKARQHG
jgi:transcriptional regulator with XRE-family HTH domain